MGTDIQFCTLSINHILFKSFLSFRFAIEYVCSVSFSNIEKNVDRMFAMEIWSWKMRKCTYTICETMRYIQTIVVIIFSGWNVSFFRFHTLTHIAKGMNLHEQAQCDHNVSRIPNVFHETSYHLWIMTIRSNNYQRSKPFLSSYN